MSVESGVENDLQTLSQELRESGLAQGALAVARAMDNFETEPSEMASCLRALTAALDRLRQLAPPTAPKDSFDEISERRKARLAGGSRAKD